MNLHLQLVPNEQNLTINSQRKPPPHTTILKAFA